MTIIMDARHTGSIYTYMIVIFTEVERFRELAKFIVASKIIEICFNVDRY